LGALLTRWTEPKSITGRFGGEEFAVFSSSIDTKQARLRAEEFRKLVAQHLFVHEELELHVTISMGLASARTESFDQLYRLADTLLYQAKDEGRNRLCSGQDAGQSLQ
jgi:diguanylate cyclase (GGDEF)-like protein